MRSDLTFLVNSVFIERESDKNTYLRKRSGEEQIIYLSQVAMSKVMRYVDKKLIGLFSEIISSIAGKPLILPSVITVKSQRWIDELKPFLEMIIAGWL